MKLRTITFALLLASTFACKPCIISEETKETPVDFAVIGAMPEEIALLKHQVEDLDSIKHRDYTFYTGAIQNKNIVFCVAGIGKVNAAITTTLLIDNFSPSALLMTGIAGSLNNEYSPGDVILASAASQHDFGFDGETFVHWATENPNTQIENKLWFECDSLLLNRAMKSLSSITLPAIKTNNYQHQPTLFVGKITTGDVFVANSKLKQHLKNWGADAVEMEGGAVAQVCQQLSTPFLLIRAISDSANEEAEVSYDELKPEVANLSAFLLVKIIESNMN